MTQGREEWAILLPHQHTSPTWNYPNFRATPAAGNCLNPQKLTGNMTAQHILHQHKMTFSAITTLLFILCGTMTIERTVLEINALSALHKISSFSSVSCFLKRLGNPLIHFLYWLPGIQTNIYYFKSNNLVRNTLKAWQLKLWRIETVCDSNCQGFACAGKDKSPWTDLNAPAKHRRQVIQDSSLWNPVQLTGKVAYKAFFCWMLHYPQTVRALLLFIFWGFLFPPSPAAAPFLEPNGSYVGPVTCPVLTHMTKSGLCLCDAFKCSEGYSLLPALGEQELRSPSLPQPWELSKRKHFIYHKMIVYSEYRVEEKLEACFPSAL